MKSILNSNRKIALALAIVLLLGLILRLSGRGWDQGLYLNPDERFLVMTATALKWPNSFSQYLNPQTSPLNPYNIDVGFFVYGHWPLNLAKGLAIVFQKDNYTFFYQVARPLTAIIDWSVILAVFLIARQLFLKHPKHRQIAVFSALAYTLMVFPLQQAHFFTVDSFVNACFVWSLYFLLLYKNKLGPIVASAIFFGLGLGSKINIVYTLPLLLMIMFFQVSDKRRFLLHSGLFGLVSYLTLRFADPYFFASANIINPLPDPRFVQNLKMLSNFGKDIFYPPAVQWINSSFTLPLKNLIIYGLGPGISVLILIGLIKLIKIYQNLGLLSQRIWFCLIIWVFFFFVWQASQMGKTMRYFLQGKYRNR